MEAVTKSKGGRPPRMQGEQTQMLIRLTVAQREKLDLLGGAAWIRERIEEAKVPKDAQSVLAPWKGAE